ncbi:hypothetical protein GCM10023322_67940 [Rugosimonospora acidiphila]|uniref:Uncharacterized protein n=1 Tax=Rugosimonospora acidiphila TaxID=556531 RepID=A0ABP9SLJ7_9ACTN
MTEPIENHRPGGDEPGLRGGDEPGLGWAPPGRETEGAGPSAPPDPTADTPVPTRITLPPGLSPISLPGYVDTPDTEPAPSWPQPPGAPPYSGPPSSGPPFSGPPSPGQSGGYPGPSWGQPAGSGPFRGHTEGPAPSPYPQATASTAAPGRTAWPGPPGLGGSPSLARPTAPIGAPGAGPPAGQGAGQWGATRPGGPAQGRPGPYGGGPAVPAPQGGPGWPARPAGANGAQRPSGLFPAGRSRPTYREPHPVARAGVAAGAASGALWMLLFGLLAGTVRAYAWLTVGAGVVAWLAAVALARFGDRGAAVGAAISTAVGVGIAGAVVFTQFLGGHWVLW